MIIDGEIIVQDAQGRSDFGALRSAITRRPYDLVFYAFDLLWLSGKDIRKLDLAQRRKLLRRLVGDHDPASPIQYSASLAGGGARLFAMAYDLGLERSEEHTSELQSLMRISYAVFCLKTKTINVVQ